jgi:hypothetical protein
VRPGQLVSTDQYVSKLKGRLPHTKGKEQEHEKYCGGTIFVDHASGRVFLRHQVTLTGSETLRAKHAFERECAQANIRVQAYRGDNGIYHGNEWQLDLMKQGQDMLYSGVGAHHQNGIAERAR